ncbi:MAG TPA: signal peptidase II [Phycisphaerae bacterium]|nr:signal peptidase II [Phycisphaerae bacterium]
MSDAPTTTTARPEHIGFKHPQSAIRAGSAHAWLWCVAIIGLAADLWTKAWAFRTLDAVQARTWIPHVLEFQLSLNAGALFGMGSGKGTLFIAASVAALGFILYLFAGTTRRQHMLHLALGMILAGALGNLYDRATNRYDRVHFAGDQDAMIGTVEDGPGDTIVFHPWFEPDRTRRANRTDLTEPVQRVGVVRDFLRIVIRVGNRSLWPWVFNIADVLLVVGVGLLIIGYWRTPQANLPAEGSAPEKPAAAPTV